MTGVDVVGVGWLAKGGLRLVWIGGKQVLKEVAVREIVHQGEHQALKVLPFLRGMRVPGVGKEGIKATQQFISFEQKLANASPKVQEGYKFITQWLGKGSRAIINDSGDLVLMSKDGLRKMRFDVLNPHGYPPHMHLEILRNGKWRNAIPGIHHLYPKQ